MPLMDAAYMYPELPQKLARRLGRQVHYKAHRLGNRCLRGGRPRQKLFVACFPKSGSTYLCELLCALTGWPRLTAKQGAGGVEHDLCKFTTEQNRFRHGVIQQHVQGKRPNLAIMHDHHIRPVVLVRNLLDVVRSLDDHLRKERRIIVSGHVLEDYLEAPDEIRWMFLIRHHLPWYFDFLMSWQEAESTIEMMWMTYEELFADQHAAFQIGSARRTATAATPQSGIETLRAVVSQHEVLIFVQGEVDRSAGEVHVPG